MGNSSGGTGFMSEYLCLSTYKMNIIALEIVCTFSVFSYNPKLLEFNDQATKVDKSLFFAISFYK